MKSIFVFLKKVFSPKKVHLIAFSLGLLSVFSFAPFNIPPIMLAALAGLFMLWLEADSRFEAAKIGLWFGLGQFGLGVSWLFSSMYFYSGVLLPVAVVLTFCFVLFLSLSVALGGWIAQYFKNPKTPGRVLVLLFPAVWVLLELVRSTIFGGFPFLISGTSHVDTWLDGYAPVFGVWGVSWMIAMSAGLLLWLFKEKIWVRASVILCLIWSLGGLLQNVTWVKPVDKPIEVALVQGNIEQQKKWLADEFYPTLKTYINLTKKNMDADVVVWPETAIPAYFDVVKKGALQGFIRDAKLLNTDILAGVIAGGEDTENYYNALVNMHNPEQRYYKKHLVPFSEFFPFSSAFAFVSGLFNIPFAEFTRGDDAQKLFELGGQYAGLSICYEMAFGEELAESLPQAKYLITVSNDAWFSHTFEPAQQLQEVQMRAIELGREIARSTNTGYTAIVDVKGNIKAQIEPYKEGVLRGEVQPYDGLTFYAQWKTMPILFLLFTFFGFLLAKRYLLKTRVKE